MGFERVATAYNGQQALDLVDSPENPFPDLLLIGLNLGAPVNAVKLGTTIVQQFRVPFLYLATSPSELQDRNVVRSGPHGYLVKPVEDDELRATVTLALEAVREYGHPKTQVVTPGSESEAIIVTDLTGRISYVNTLAEDLTGWSLQEARNRPYQEVFRLVDDQGNAVNHQPFQSDPSAGPVPALLAQRRGDSLRVLEKTTSLTDAAGSLAGLYILFAPDPSPQINEESDKAGPPDDKDIPTATASEPDRGQLSAIVEGIADPLFAMDSEWRLTFMNQEAEEHLGRPRGSVIGRVFWDEFPNSIHAKYYYEYYKAGTRQQPRDFEFQHEAKDRWFEVHVYPFSEGLVVFLRDVTERKQAEAQSSKLEKLESLGLLARGFAHDFNNLLTVLLGNLSLAAVQLPGERGYGEAIDAAKQATIQAQNLVQQLLTFAKGGVPITDTANLNELVEAVLGRMSRLPHIEYSSDLPDQPVLAEADIGQLQRLLENLIKNAEEAMPAGGSIRIQSRLLDRDQYQGTLPNLDPNTQYVVLSVHDNGEGIPDSHLDRVFEPYFSTRTTANATGLGLTVCDSIARAHKGFLVVDSRFGSHTSASLFLPALHQSWQAVEDQNLLRGRRPANATPRILILEDEKPIRTLMSITLKREGYEVVETEEGRQTVEAYRQALEAGQCFDLLVTDLSIPGGMGGAEAMQQIRYIDPNVVAVVSSGYSDDPVMAHHEQYGFAAVLPKPYDPSALTKLVRDLLRGEVFPA